MSNSRLIAGLIGPLLLVIGAAMLLNPAAFSALLQQLPQSYGVVFLAGALGLVGGLAILRFHNIWSADWRVLITILAWLSAIGGAGRMVVPNEAASLAQSFVGAPWFAYFGIVPLALGAFLTFKGYEGKA